MKLFSIIFLVLFSINVIAEEASHDDSGKTSDQSEVDKRAKRTLERLEKFIKDACTVTRPQAATPGATPQTGGQPGAGAVATTPSASNTTSPTPGTSSISSSPSGSNGSALFTAKCTSCHSADADHSGAKAAAAIRSGKMPPATAAPDKKLSEEEKKAILDFLG